MITKLKKVSYINLIIIYLNKTLVLKKLKQIEDKLNDIEAKISNLSLRIGKLEDNSGNQDELEKLKKELENLKNYHDQTVIKVSNNKELIDLILGRLNDIVNGSKEGDEKLQKEIDDLKQKLSDLNSQIDILLKMPRGEGKSDLSAINDLMKKIMELEKNFNAFVEKVNIDEIYRQLKFLDETKADKKDLDDLSEKYNNHQIEIEAIKKRLDSLFSQLMNKTGEQSPTINVDFSHYITKSEFEKHKKENEQEFSRIWEEIENLKNLINQIFNILKTKANLSDLDDLKNFLLGKIEELALASVKKFADKNETTNNFRYLEDQNKKILELLQNQKPSSDAETWLLAKKPINGYACASCESFIGDLREDSHKFIPWNKLPLRDPGDKLYRMGNGFSKMLQMLNFDNYGNVSLSPNIVNEATNNSNESNNRVASAFPGKIRDNNYVNNNLYGNGNNMRPGIKKRIQSAKPKVRTELKKNMMMNNVNGNSNMEKNGDEIVPDVRKEKNDELYPDIYKNGKGDMGPKITKIIRKTSNKKFGNKDNVSTD